MKTLSIRQYLARPTKLAETEFAKEESAPKNTMTKYRALEILRTRENELRAAQCHWRAEGMTPRRAYEKSEWTDFVGVTYLEPVLEHIGYTGVAAQLATTTTPPAGYAYFWREYDRFEAGRMQEVGDNQAFQTRKGEMTKDPVAFHTIGDAFFVSEEERLDTPFDVSARESRAIAANMALERDLRIVDAWYKATSGDNATDFQNVFTIPAGVWENSDDAIKVLLALTIWINSPFELTDTDLGLTLTTTMPGGELEQLQRIGKYRVTDVVLGGAKYYALTTNDKLWNKNYFEGARILDNGALQIPLLGLNIHRANIGYLSPTNDWTADDSVYLIDRPNGGGGVIAERQPLSIRTWENPEFRRTTTAIYCREGYVVENRRAIYRLTYGS